MPLLAGPISYAQAIILGLLQGFPGYLFAR
jgi:hypothetical protein